MTPKYFVVVEYTDKTVLAYSFFSLKNARAVVKENQNSCVVKNVYLTKVMK